MSFLKKFFENTRKPQKGLGGEITLRLMNFRHSKNALWGLKHLEIPLMASILDIGCGGGGNIANLLNKAIKGKVCGIDCSQASVGKSKKVNRKAISEGRADIFLGSVSSLPFNDNKFDIITAFETVYFWPNLTDNFKEVLRILKDGGTFFICNEASKPEGFERWIDMLDMQIYTKEALSKSLSKAGFCNISCHIHGNDKWLCITALKSKINS